jgi:hypothetical protein
VLKFINIVRPTDVPAIQSRPKASQ